MFPISDTNQPFYKLSNWKHLKQLNCKSCGLNYLLQCQICYLQYVGKGKIAFNLWLNNHRKDRKAKNAILACKHFQASNHNLQQETKYMLIERQITKPAATEHSHHSKKMRKLVDTQIKNTSFKWS